MQRGCRLYTEGWFFFQGFGQKCDVNDPIEHVPCSGKLLGRNTDSEQCLEQWNSGNRCFTPQIQRRILQYVTTVFLYESKNGQVVAVDRNTFSPQASICTYSSHDREDYERPRRRTSAELPDVFHAMMLADCIIFIRCFPWAPFQTKADPDVSPTRWRSSERSWQSFSTFISSWGLTWSQRSALD